MQYFVRFSPSSAEIDNGWGGKLNHHVDGQLYEEYSLKNLLQLDHFSSSYDEKKFWFVFMPNSVV